MAERELASFAAAVTESFGAAQAELATEDWINELERIACRPGDAIPCWRQATIAAASRLANRVAVLGFGPATSARCHDIPLAELGFSYQCRENDHPLSRSAAE